jgi:tRNA(Phe) wybutosine-synthesizing methylase Tyw3
MSWTYTGDPSASKQDEVRFLLGDIKHTEQSLSDEEIMYLLSVNSDDAYMAASEAAGRMAVRYLGLSATTKKVGDLWLQKQYSAEADRYYELQRVLRTGRTAYDVGAPKYTDTSTNIFHVGMNDNPTSWNPRYGAW